jgi:hypothetical protein
MVVDFRMTIWVGLSEGSLNVQQGLLISLIFFLDFRAYIADLVERNNQER